MVTFKQSKVTIIPATNNDLQQPPQLAQTD
jgi:hypothetical protein